MNAQDRAVRGRDGREAKKEDTNMATPTKKATAAKKAPANKSPNGPVKTTKVNPEAIALENDLQAIQDEAAMNGKPVRKPKAKTAAAKAIVEDRKDRKAHADAAEKMARKGKASAERHAKAADQANLTEKKCTRCGVVKPRSEYQANRTHSDNMQSRCKQCMHELRLENAPSKEKAS